MAALLTLDGLKRDILAAAKPFGIFPGYWDIMRSTDYQELIDALIPWLVYAYRSFIITDAMLGEFDEALLNQNGIYTTGTNAITNPGLEIFVLKTAILTVPIDDGSRHNINVMGQGSATVTISGNSYGTLSTWHTATANVTLNDTSILWSDSRQKSTLTLAQTGTSISDLRLTDDTQLNINLAVNAYSLTQGTGQSKITKTGAGTLEQRLYELSQNPISNPISV